MAAVDVVLATYNRQDRLPRCLRALARQRFTDFRLILVDDGSSPPVAEMLPEEFFHTLDLEIVRCKNGGPAHARNLGLQSSTAPLVAFIDDDVVAEPGWLEAHLAAQGSSAAPTATFGPLSPPRDWQSTPWNYWEAATVTAQYDQMARGIYAPTWRQFFTGNAMVPRDRLLAAGGFDERFTRAEDIEMAYRLELVGCSFAFVQDAVGWHYSERTRESWLRIATDYGRFDVLFDQLHPENGHLARIRRELRGRHPLMRALRGPIQDSTLRRFTLPAALATGGLFHRAGLHRLSVRCLSVVYDAEYRRSLRSAVKAARQAPATPGPQPINRPSTESSYAQNQ